MYTILVVEDDKMIRAMVKARLEEHDFLVLEAYHGKRMMQILECHSVDLILLDVSLSDGNGIEFLKDLRSRSSVPVIIISGRHDKSSVLSGLQAGADDYIEKPFDLDVLLARVNCKIKRLEEPDTVPLGAAGVANSECEIRFGGWVFDPARFQIFHEDGQEGDLTYKEFALLNALIAQPGKPLKRDDLCEAIRAENYVPTPRAIDVKITRIRKKIGDDAAHPELIKTVRGIGYMFNPEKITTAQK